MSADQALTFLQMMIRPNTWANVVAIDPHMGVCTGLGFQTDDLASVQYFIEKNADSNLYWSVNSLGGRIDKKATKADVITMAYVHLDKDSTDPYVLEELRNAPLPPTTVVFSGGGYQAFWRLKKPPLVNGNLAQLESVNRRVVAYYGGDVGTFNIDRIMRLPGTTNWPTPTKLKKGRVPIDAKLIEHHPEHQYDLNQFQVFEIFSERTESLQDNRDLNGLDRSRDLLSKVSRDVRARLSDDEILRKYRDHPHARDQSDPNRAVRRCINRARGGVGNALPSPPPLEAHAGEDAAEEEPRLFRRIVQLQAGELHTYAADAERLVANELYVRGGKLVRIGAAPELGPTANKVINRDIGQRVIVAANVEYLRRKLNTVAEFQKFSRQRSRWEPIDCPRDLATNILMAGEWAHFAPLDAISTAPFLRPDLTLCTVPGYDRASGVFYAPNAEFPSLPDRITKDDAAAALTRLLKPFEQFPFATSEAQAAFLTHMLAAVARQAIDTVPVKIYAAPDVATGKTLLSGMPSRVADGVEPAARPYTGEPEELRKVLLSALLAGDREITFDNVPSGAKVHSAVLCGFVTASVYADRVLGVSDSPRLPNRCTVVMTGNNISPAGDLARRCIVVRLDVNKESARGRAFDIVNLKEYVRQHRPALLIDALTIISGYIQAGQPNSAQPLESFERWSRLARDPLLWLEQANAVDTQQLETEDELGPLKEAFEVLDAWPHFTTKAFSAQDLAKVCAGFAGETLRESMQTAGCSDATSPAKVGYWLREHRDRVAGEWKLVQDRVTHGRALWKLQSIK